MEQSHYLCRVITLTGHIEYLILRHDCVVIPGIGALIAHRKPAYIDQELGCIFPPGRSLSFNPEIIHNDGLLASSVARKDNVTYDEASAIVSEQVREMQSIIQVQGELALGRLGILYANNENKSTYLFEPFTATNVSPRLTGLVPVGMKTLSELTSEPSESKKSTKELYYVPVSRNIIQIATSIIVFLMLGFALSTPIVDESANQASMGIAITKGQADIYSPIFDENPYISLNIAYPDQDEACSTVAERPTAKACPDSVKRINADDSYFLIVASLPSKALADDYISHHSESDSLGVLEVDGRFRVYAASGATYSEANSYNKSGRYPDAWVCKR